MRIRYRVIILFFIILLIKVFAFNPVRVEQSYSLNFFPWLSSLLRGATGWLQLSIGDVLYFLTAMWLIYKLTRFIISLFLKQRKGKSFRRSAINVLITGMMIYVIFNVCWGLNYNRQGIAYQLNLDTARYTNDDLKNIQQLLIQKVNESKQSLINLHESYPDNKNLFIKASNCYQRVAKVYPFLKYSNSSTKSSVFGWWGNYLGFTGYYNPFSGEAQVNTTVPKFIQPYTTCHEIAHQIGYAKEDEANFVGYLSATLSADTLFRYSAYLDLFLYANREIYFKDSIFAKEAYKQLIDPVKADIIEWKQFLINHRSAIDAVVTWAYGKFLKANEQPEGMYTYNEVIADLIAFYKKTGRI